MRLHVIYDEIHRLHMDPYGRRPENPSRLERALSALRVPGLGVISLSMVFLAST